MLADGEAAWHRNSGTCRSRGRAARQLKHLFADPTGLVPAGNRFDHYINGRLTAPVCSFQTLLPPSQGRWAAVRRGWLDNGAA